MEQLSLYGVRRLSYKMATLPSFVSSSFYSSLPYTSLYVLLEV
jgi:hypothetical protein